MQGERGKREVPCAAFRAGPFIFPFIFPFPFEFVLLKVISCFWWACSAQNPLLPQLSGPFLTRSLKVLSAFSSVNKSRVPSLVFIPRAPVSFA